MRLTTASSIRNDLLQVIADNTHIPVGASNPTIVEFSGTTTRAGGVTADLFTYTVPANKVAVIEYWEIAMIRDAAASPVGIDLFQIEYDESGGGTTTIGTIRHKSNSTGVEYKASNNTSYALSAGDDLVVRCSGASTGGTMAYVWNAAVYEYDEPT